MRGGSLFISLSSGCFSIKCHLLIKIFLRLGTDGLYCVTKGINPFCTFCGFCWSADFLWDTKREEIDQFILEVNRHHPTIKFTAEISEEKTNFLDTTIFKGERFYKDSIFDIRTHFKPTETFQYTHFSSCHAPGVKKAFIKGEALGLLRTNSSKATFEENVKNFRSHLRVRGYPGKKSPRRSQIYR